MPIPSVSPEILQAAMARFDRELRDKPDWADWEKNKAHLYAIERADQPVHALQPGQTTKI